ncbi:MAG: hypothetical protein ACSLEW_06780 [Nocardioides sp.]
MTPAIRLNDGNESETEDQMAAITGLGRPDGRLFGGDPATHEEM